MKKLIIQLIKFGIVGVIAFFIDFGVLVFLKEILHCDVLIASAISFTVSVIINYILSMLFVFESGQSNKTKEFVIFVALSIGGLLLNQLIMWLGTDIVMIDYRIVKILACAIVMLYNFVTRKIFLEKKGQ